jgi:hypothetical protein
MFYPQIEVINSNISAIGATTPNEEQHMINLGNDMYEVKGCGQGWECQFGLTRVGEVEGYTGNLTMNGIIEIDTFWEGLVY